MLVRWDCRLMGRKAKRPRRDATPHHTVQVMLTCCGELCAVGAVTVTVPLSRTLLTVTVWYIPAPRLPLPGLSL